MLSASDEETNLADVIFIVEHEGGDVGRDDGCIEDENQDEPVPDGFERRVVKDREMMDVERLHLVFRHHLSTQRQNLQYVRVAQKTCTFPFA